MRLKCAEGGKEVRCIMTERIYKTIVVLFGAALMIGLGMMVISNMVRKSGLFEVLAIWADQ